MAEYDASLTTVPYKNHLDLAGTPSIDRYTVLLKDGETTATIYPIHRASDLPAGLLLFLCDEFNMEVERGDTCAFFDPLTLEQFQAYWFGAFAAVMVLGDAPLLQGSREWEKECLGTFFIKSNYPGRCSHICSANFLVNAGIRGKGIGRTLTDCYLQWAPQLGFTYSLFNLVFESNVAARSIWESLNFKRVGRVDSAGILKGHDTAVDAIIYGRELIDTSDPALGSYRFDKIKFYLETGRYPAMADRQEKLRLRSSASHYRLVDGKLMLKGREVVSDPVRQLQVCTEMHLSCHGGINKTTALVTEKYHWARIKDTAATAVKNCNECRDPIDDVALVKREHSQKSSAMNASRKALKTFHLPQSAKRARTNQDVDAMVAAASLHNSHDHDHLLESDLSVLDDNLIAVVQEAQRSQNNRLRRPLLQLNSHRDNLLHHLSYAAAAAAAVIDCNPYQQITGSYLQHSDYSNHHNKQHNLGPIPVDPAVSAYDHQPGGAEIEIARAIIEANQDPNRRTQRRTPESHLSRHHNQGISRSSSVGQNLAKDSSQPHPENGQLTHNLDQNLTDELERNLARNLQDPAHPASQHTEQGKRTPQLFKSDHDVFEDR